MLEFGIEQLWSGALAGEVKERARRLQDGLAREQEQEEREDDGHCGGVSRPDRA